MGRWALGRRGCATLVVLLLSLVATDGLATLYPNLSLADLAAKSDAVVDVTIERKDARWLQGGRRIATFYQARVNARLGGGDHDRAELKAGQKFTFVLPGGEVGDFGQVIPGVPNIEPGDRAVVFVSEPVGPAAERRVVGLGLGVFIENAHPPQGGAPRFERKSAPAQTGLPTPLGALSLDAIQRAVAEAP